jgi:HK97 gp10 family phage protein
MANQDFIVDIERFIQKAGKRQDQFVREFCQDLAEKVVENTPVQTGFLRGSWAAGIGAPAIAASVSDPSPRIALNLSRAKAGDTIFISNSASYGAFVEFGTSRMSPRAFVRRTVAQAQTIAQNTLNRIAKA